MTAQFTIAKNGKVADVHIVETTFMSPVFEACVAEEIFAWSFPGLRNETAVLASYPLCFPRVAGRARCAARWSTWHRAAQLDLIWYLHNNHAAASRTK
jgi:hypothetical protein